MRYTWLQFVTVLAAGVLTAAEMLGVDFGLKPAFTPSNHSRSTKHNYHASRWHPSNNTLSRATHPQVGVQTAAHVPAQPPAQPALQLPAQASPAAPATPSIPSISLLPACPPVLSTEEYLTDFSIDTRDLTDNYSASPCGTFLILSSDPVEAPHDNIRQLGIRWDYDALFPTQRLCVKLSPRVLEVNVRCCVCADCSACSCLDREGCRCDECDCEEAGCAVCDERAREERAVVRRAERANRRWMRRMAAFEEDVQVAGGGAA